MIRQVLQVEPNDETAEPEQRRRLHHDKAEATSRYNEGRRLARHRDELRHRFPDQPGSHGLELAAFTQEQLQVLQQRDSGALLTNQNSAIVELGHGRLHTARGAYMDIGGSTGGGPRRILDAWHPPDWRQFLQDE